MTIVIWINDNDFLGCLQYFSDLLSLNPGKAEATDIPKKSVRSLGNHSDGCSDIYKHFVGRQERDNE